MEPHTETTRAGEMLLWILGVLVAFGCIAALAWMQMPVGDARAPGGAADFDPAVAAERVAVLGERFNAAVQNDDDLKPILQSARATVKEFPDYAPAHRQFGVILIQAERPRDAYEHLVHSLELDPKQPEVCVLAGTLAMQARDHAEAVEHYRAAVRMEPAVVKHRLFLATALQRDGKAGEAKRTLERVLKLDSSAHAAHAGLADLHAEAGEMSAARDRLRRAMKILGDEHDPAHTAYALRLATLLREEGKVADAVSVLDNLLPDSAKREARVLEALAGDWTELGQPRRAAQAYEMALAQHPTNETFAAEAARHFHLAEDSTNAKRMLERLRGINPGSPDLPELGKMILEE